jgi:vancomycin resistance protein YoaR
MYTARPATACRSVRVDLVTATPFIEKLTPTVLLSVPDSITMSKRRRAGMIGGGITLGLLLLLVAGWGIESAVSGDRAARKITVAGMSVGGLDHDDIIAVAGDLTASLSQASATLNVGDRVIETDPVALGVRVDGETLADDALTARRGGFFLARPFRWLGSFFGEEELDVPYLIDKESAAQAVIQLVENELDGPLEPILDIVGGELVVVPGADGATLADDVMAEALPDMLEAGQPYELTLDPQPLLPDLDTDQLVELADEANERTADDIIVQVLASQAVISSEQMRSWVLLNFDDEEPVWIFDEATLIAELKPQFTGLGSEDQQARFEVVNGKPVIIPASESVVCCEEGSADALKAALAEPLPEPSENEDEDQDDASSPDDDEDVEPELPERIVELAPVVSGSTEGVAELEVLGIVEEVATFTTNHSCCENRVTNIQLMADIVKGAVIKPGETFSLNAYVGKRTSERGFLPAGAIARGVLEAQVGGGVSQFTTTIFNAAFFAGIEFVEYQSHSLYFSRYPRGREATISWPKPDFKIRNDTPYGILVWPTYDDTSITVTLYSTKHIEVEDIGRTETSQGACTRVTTTRQRVWEDGTEKIDSVFAVYRPGQGLDCAGNPTVPPATTTTVPGDTTPTSVGDTTPTSVGDTTPTTAGEGETTTTPVPTPAPPSSPTTSGDG